ncbi:hypothetical protein [Phaeovulum sp. W22_SRMD_FR3]|uniref:hypothetical protein n=1 Tax=Phaeovulum sp. W22_SRMD_FR3 TaxID=3240274 RepID=UPI003F9E2E3B
MEYVIWAGAVISALGLAGILACIVIVSRAKRARLSDEAMRAKMQRVVALNLGALFTSVIGLMIVVVGIVLK